MLTEATLVNELKVLQAALTAIEESSFNLVPESKIREIEIRVRVLEWALSEE